MVKNFKRKTKEKLKRQKDKRSDVLMDKKGDTSLRNLNHFLFLCSLEGKGGEGGAFNLPLSFVSSPVVSIIMLTTIALLISIISLLPRKLLDLISNLIYDQDSMLFNALLYARQPPQIIIFYFVM